MIIMCFVNQKGGVGKTTSVMNIGAGLAKLSNRVLLIDLDPQESLSYWLGMTDAEKTIFDFFDGKANLESCILPHSGGFDVIPAKEMLATITPDVYQLKRALTKLDYDFVLLDCSPTLGMMTLAALTAAHWVIIPMCPDLLSIKGMSQLLGTIQTIREQTNANIALKSVIATRYDSCHKMHREVLEQIDVFLDGVPIYTVREDIAVSESPVSGMSVMDYRPESTGAEDYMAIATRLADGKHDFKTAVTKVLAHHFPKAADAATKSPIDQDAPLPTSPVIVPILKEAEELQTMPVPPSIPEKLIIEPPVIIPMAEETEEKQTVPFSPPLQEAPTSEPPIALSRCNKNAPNQKRMSSFGLKASVMIGLIVLATAITVLFVQSAPKVQQPAAQQTAQQTEAQQPITQQPPIEQPPAATPPTAVVVKPEKMILKGVQFDYDKDILQPQSYPILNNIVTLAKQHPEWKFRLTGHTDSWGDDAYNMNLSLRRVQAVKYYLVNQGIADSRLTVVGKGRSERITTNDTADGRAQNRRVELEVE